MTMPKRLQQNSSTPAINSISGSMLSPACATNNNSSANNLFDTEQQAAVAETDIPVLQLDDKYTLIYEQDADRNEQEPLLFNECVQLDTATGVVLFVDPDPRLLYLKKCSRTDQQSAPIDQTCAIDRTVTDASAASGDVCCSAKGTDVHSMQWWGLQSSDDLKVSSN